ncbi:FAD-dependent oxidoreductase [Agromyces sp. MMS24-K17]|uniref:FAD-dependent oxidoreductase n=1 Tax=Agromyces sp. MMS24-K17 TaxID=3372850 RepID=UPI00375486AB
MTRGSRDAAPARDARAAPDPDRVHDVAVVGGGAVGLLLACLLARRGVDVVVLERRDAPAGRTRAIGIHPPGLAALDAAGVGAEVRRLAVPIRDGVVACRGRVLGRLAFTGEPVRSLPQRETEALLEARLARLAPGALHRDAEVVGVRERGPVVEVELAADRAADRAEDRAGSGSRVVARYVVGADGVRSRVREAAGIGWAARPGRAEYVMGDADDTMAAPATALLYFEPAGVVESFPLPGGRRRWVAWLRRRPAVPLTAHGLATIVAARTGASVDLAGAAEPSTFTAQQHLADRFAAGRIALVGDAAHEVSPIGGQGMNLGWLDALELDRVLARVLAADDARAADAGPDPFGGYARVRRRAAGRAIRQAWFNMTMGGAASGARLRARNALVRVLGVPPVRRLLASAFTMRGL